MSDAAGARRRSSLRSASPPPARVERSPRGASPAPAKPPKAAKGKAAKPTGLWHSTAGGAPTFRGKTALQRFASAAGLISLIVFTPPVAIVTCVARAAAWTRGPSARECSSPPPSRSVHVLIHNKGSVAGFVDDARKAGVFTHLLAILPPVDFTGRAARLLATFASFEALLLMFMPGKRFVGTVTAAGNRPVYKARRSGLRTAARAHASPGQRLPVLRRHLRGVLCCAAVRGVWSSQLRPLLKPIPFP